MDSFIGEIKFVGFDWAPQNWANCDGTMQQIAQNQALFSLLGNTFGGDGSTTFALPDLCGRTPIHTHNAAVLQGTSLDEQVIETFALLPTDETRTVRYSSYYPGEIEHGKSCHHAGGEQRLS